MSYLPGAATTGTSTVLATHTVLGVAFVTTSLYLCFSSAEDDATPFTNTSTISTATATVTWTKLANTLVGLYQGTVWVGICTAAATGTTTVTLSQAATNGGRAVIIPIPFPQNADVPTPTSSYAEGAVGAQGTSTTPTVALGDYSGGLWVSWIAQDANQAASPRTGWTELSDTASSNVSFETQYTASGDRTADATIVSAHWIIMAVHIARPSYTADAQEDDPVLFSQPRTLTVEDEASDSDVWAIMA